MTSKRAFVLHFVEMLIVMFVGMGVCSGLTALSYAAAGSSFGDQPGAAQVLLMGVNMTVPMAAWMTLRRHPWVRTNEMAAAMFLPGVAAAAFVATDTIDVGPGMLAEHVVMIPAMLGVMLWRYDEYAHIHPQARADTEPEPNSESTTG